MDTDSKFDRARILLVFLNKLRSRRMLLSGPKLLLPFILMVLFLTACTGRFNVEGGWAAPLISGDTVFVGRTGRTIGSGSNIATLYNSIYNIILKLPLDTMIYPGHHYGFTKTITIKDNIKYSEFFNCNGLEEFILVMKNFEQNRKNS